MLRVAATLLLCSLAIAQKNRSNSSDPTFTFTPAHGNKIEKGHFSPGGSFSFIDEFDGMVYSVEIDKVDMGKLPPHAHPVEKRGRFYLPLDPRRARSPIGYVPLWVRQRVSWREC